tara:strand:- start:534 stop:1337 length:804 start_codon:yes stop_codon:yes gene_type:complete
MLGLGISLSTSGAVSSGLSPSDISGLDLWLKVNTGIVAASGNTSDAGNMADAEDINSWADQSGNDRHASQGTASKKPHWETDSADFGGLVWPDDTADTHMNLATYVGGDTDNIEANEDFTIMIRVKLTDFSTGMGLMGDGSKEVIKWTDNSRVGIFIGGNTPIRAFEEEGGLTLATDTYYIHTLTRSNGSTGNLTYHVHGGVHSDKDWDSAESHTDPDAFAISNIGCAGDNLLPAEGVFKDVIIWKGTALSDAERNDMYTYILGQTY